MKKIFLAIVVLACFSSQIDAQIKFGVKAGLNFDSFAFKENVTGIKDTYDGATGWQIGGMLQVKVPIIGIAVQPELLYTVKKTDTDNGISYFEVPVHLSWGPDLLVVRPYVMAGPYFGFVVNTVGEISKDAIEKMDMGISLGAGLDIWKLQATARYSLGLKDLSSHESIELKSRTFTLSLGYFF